MENLFLFTGPEIGGRAEAIAKVKASLQKKYGAVDFHNLYIDSTPVLKLMSLLQTGNLFMSAICVVLNNAEEIKKKEEIEAIVKWKGESKNYPAFLILVSDEIAINKTLEAAVPKGQKQIFWELFEEKKREWIKAFFAKNKMKIEDEAIDLILELVENNTDALKMTSSQLVLFFDAGAKITEEDVERLISHTKEESAFSLFDAMVGLNLEQSIAIAQKLMQVKNTSPIQIIAGLTFCFRRLLDWHEAIREVGYFDELNMKKKGFTSKSAISQYKKAQSNFSVLETKRILSAINKCDYEMRVSGTALQNVLLERLVYFIVAKRECFLPKYTTPFDVFE